MKSVTLSLILLTGLHIHIIKHFNHYDAYVTKNNKQTVLVDFSTKKAARKQAIRFAKAK